MPVNTNMQTESMEMTQQPNVVTTKQPVSMKSQLTLALQSPTLLWMWMSRQAF